MRSLEKYLGVDIMLEQLYKKGYLNYEQLILNHSKALGLNVEEAYVLILILKNYLKTNALSVETLQEQVLMTSSKLDKVVASLMERSYYEIYLSYDKGKGKECISFKPLFQMMESLLEQKINTDSYNIEKVIHFISSKMNRVLTASELEILQGLIVEDHYTYDQIVNVVDYITSSNRTLSMKTIASNLANRKYQIQPEVDAPASFQEFLKRI